MITAASASALNARVSGIRKPKRLCSPEAVGRASPMPAPTAAPTSAPCVTIVCGPSACGKSTVGRTVAEAKGCAFLDGDDFHPASNIAKMAASQPLTDEDRWPWLDRLASVIQDHAQREQCAVIACSALKLKYREKLQGSADVANKVEMVLLDPPAKQLLARLQRRGHHFMPPTLLSSQLDSLERPAYFSFSTVIDSSRGWQLVPGTTNSGADKLHGGGDGSTAAATHVTDDRMLLHVVEDPASGAYPSVEECAALVLAALDAVTRQRAAASKAAA